MNTQLLLVSQIVLNVGEYQVSDLPLNFGVRGREEQAISQVSFASMYEEVIQRKGGMIVMPQIRLKD